MNNVMTLAVVIIMLTMAFAGEYHILNFMHLHLPALQL